jgi:hypothetical protein
MVDAVSDECGLMGNPIRDDALTFDRSSRCSAAPS